MHEQPRLISLQRSQDLGSKPSQADGKMFLFSSLKLFIKSSLLPRPREGEGETWLAFRICAKIRSRRLAPHRNSRKRDCGLALSVYLSVYPSPTSAFLFHPHAPAPPFPFPSRGLTLREIFRVGEENVEKRMAGGR